jgi:hypothetical protein
MPGHDPIAAEPIASIGAPNAPAASRSPIPFRYGMIAAALAVATGFPAFQEYGVTIAAANPVIPYRTTEFIDTESYAVPIASQYGRVMPFVPSVPSANPVIGYRIGQASKIDPSLLVVPQRGPVPAPQPYAVPAPRIVSVPPAESLTLPVSRYTPFPFVSVSVATANAVIPPRITSPFPETPTDLIRAAFYEFPYFAPTIAPANAVIPIRTRPLGELRELAATEYPAFRPYSYTDTVVEATANPVIPIRIGQLPSDAVAPLVGIQGYQRFPFTNNSVTPTNTIIPYRARLLSELARVELPPQSWFESYTYNPTANPVIAIRIGQQPSPPIERLVEPRFVEFPFYQFTVAPANPVIRIIQGRIAYQLPAKMETMGYIVFPWFSTVPPPAGTLRSVIVRGNHPTGFDDYEESWFG